MYFFSIFKNFVNTRPRFALYDPLTTPNRLQILIEHSSKPNSTNFQEFYSLAWSSFSHKKYIGPSFFISLYVFIVIKTLRRQLTHPCPTRPLFPLWGYIVIFYLYYFDIRIKQKYIRITTSKFKLNCDISQIIRPYSPL